jgi:hypothetical protein
VLASVRRSNQILELYDTTPWPYQYNYTYDGVGNRITEIGNSGVFTWTYDNVRQLLVEPVTYGLPLTPYVSTYKYDSVGNRALMVSSHQPRP